MECSCSQPSCPESCNSQEWPGYISRFTCQSFSPTSTGPTANIGHMILCDQMVNVIVILHFVKLVKIEGLNCCVWINVSRWSLWHSPTVKLSMVWKHAVSHSDEKNMWKLILNDVVWFGVQKCLVICLPSTYITCQSYHIIIHQSSLISTCISVLSIESFIIHILRIQSEAIFANYCHRQFIFSILYVNFIMCFQLIYCIINSIIFYILK